MLDRNSTLRALALLGLAALAATVSNATASRQRYLPWINRVDRTSPTPAVPSPQVSPTTPDASPAATPAAAQPGFEIGTTEARAEHDAGTLFLDARRSDAYAEGHIAGARSFSVWESDVDDKILALMGEVPFEARIVVYCTGGDCEDSHLLRDKLLSAGYGDVLVDRDGMPGWEAAGHPVER